MRAFGVVVVLVAVGALAFVAGSRYGRPAPGGQTSAGKAVLYYMCPMHPSYRSDKQGDAPCCGMRLEPVYADGSGAGAGTPAASTSGSDGALHLSAEKQKLVGVKIGRAEAGSRVQRVRVPGIVAIDETRVRSVVAGSTGWVRGVSAVASGDLVAADQLLGTYYSRDLINAQQAYFYALRTLTPNSSLPALGAPRIGTALVTPAQAESAEETLESLGMSRTQMKAIAMDQQVAKDIEIRAPVKSLVLERTIYTGQKFDRGEVFYKLADLSRVWVLADVFETDPLLAGRRLRASVVFGGKRFAARMTDAVPQVDSTDRTQKVRLDVDNPRLLLRPGMFVDIECDVRLPAAATVPVDAVIDSGMRKRVFVVRGDGSLAPRTVETGWRLGGRIAVTKGLRPGEKIVTAGNFLLDSESRMKESAPSSAGSSPSVGSKVKDPVCGMSIDPAAARGTSMAAGKKVYFCSMMCKERYDKAHPAHGSKMAMAGGGKPTMPAMAMKHTMKPMATAPRAGAKTVPKPAPARDLVCGMEVDPATARYVSTYQGRKYYFCAPGCKEAFDKGPAKFTADLPKDHPM